MNFILMNAFERCIFNVKPFDVDVAIVIDDETVSETTYETHIFIHKVFCVFVCFSDLNNFLGLET